MYSNAVLTRVFDVIDCAFTVPEILAEPTFNPVFAVIVPLIRVVLATITPACNLAPYTPPDAVTVAAFAVVFAVIVPPMNSVLATMLPACSQAECASVVVM